MAGVSDRYSVLVRGNPVTPSDNSVHVASQAARPVASAARGLTKSDRPIYLAGAFVEVQMSEWRHARTIAFVVPFLLVLVSWNEAIANEGKPFETRVDWEWITLPRTPCSAVHVCISTRGGHDDTLGTCKPTDLRREFH